MKRILSFTLILLCLSSASFAATRQKVLTETNTASAVSNKTFVAPVLGAATYTTLSGGAVTSSGLITGNANLNIANGATTAGVLKLLEDTDAGANFASFQVPTLAADTVYTLPADDGAVNEVLITDGAGVMDWILLTTSNLATDSVSADELNATGVESELESELDIAGEVSSTGMASTVIADSVTVTGWVMGTSTATTPPENDNDTSLATTAYVQTELASVPSSTDIDTANNNISLLGFKLAVVGSLSYFNMIDGFLDEYEDQTGIDTTASTNESYDATNDLYINAAATADLSDAGEWTNEGSNFSFTGDDINTLVGEKAMSSLDTHTSDFTYSLIYKTTTTDWSIAGVYAISEDGTFVTTNHNGGMTSMTNSWWLRADGVIKQGGTTVGSTISMTTDAVIKFERVGSTFKIYKDDVLQHTWALTSSAEVRMVIGAGNTASPSHADVGWTVTVTADMTLISAGVAAEAEPTNARLVLFEQDVTAQTLNTDIKGWASRDNGTTYTQITLADEGDYTSGQRVLTGSADISAQPSGTTMRYKVTTHNTKDLKLHGAHLSWD